MADLPNVWVGQQSTDSLLEVAIGNVLDAMDIGFYGHYQPAAIPLYAGLFRDATDGKFRLFKDLQVQPANNVVNTAGAGYTAADLVVGGLTAASLNVLSLNVGDGVTAGDAVLSINAPAANYSILNFKGGGVTNWSLFRPAATSDLQLDSNGFAGAMHFTNAGKVTFGGITALTGDQLSVKAAANKWLGLGSGNAAGAVRLQAFNDAANANVPLELQGSTLSLRIGATEYLGIAATGVSSFANGIIITGAAANQTLSISANNPDYAAFNLSSTVGTNAVGQIFTNTGSTLAIGMDNSVGARVFGTGTTGTYQAYMLTFSNRPIVFGTNGAARLFLDGGANLLTLGDGVVAVPSTFNINSPNGNSAQLQWSNAGAAKWNMFRPGATNDLQLDSNGQAGVMTWSNAGAVAVAKSFDAAGGDLRIYGQKFQAFNVTLFNNAGTIQHAFGDISDNNIGVLSDRINGCIYALTNTPTGADNVTAFAAGAKIGTAYNGILIFDCVNAQVSATALGLATMVYNDTGTAWMVIPFLVSRNVNGVTKVRVELNFTNPTTGAAIALTAANIPAGKQFRVTLLIAMT